VGQAYRLPADMNSWAAKIRAGDSRALARAVTGVENRDPRALEVLRELAPHAGHARIVGITGAPGAGKSTLVDAMAAAIRKQGKTVGIIAVDPTSPLTGGSILGDRIRMQRHHGDPGVFIRSMATRGASGGVAHATENLARLMDAAGKDYVLIETVGVGQSEVKIAGLARVTVVVLAPGMGDDVQALKAGLMEIADVFVVNKADLPGAERAESEVRTALRLGPQGRPEPPILRTVATEGAGIEELIEAVSAVAGHARPKPARKRQTRIDHLGIAVDKIDDALGLYENLGLRAAHRETVEAEKVNVAMLPAGDSRIELLEAASPDSPISRFLAKRGPGLHHVALRVPDLAAAVERLRASGARLLHEPRRGAGGHLYVFVHPASAGGVLMELIEESES